MYRLRPWRRTEAVWSPNPPRLGIAAASKRSLPRQNMPGRAHRARTKPLVRGTRLIWD